jgi:hypothetical protein
LASIGKIGGLTGRSTPNGNIESFLSGINNFPEEGTIQPAGRRLKQVIGEFTCSPPISLHLKREA